MRNIVLEIDRKNLVGKTKALSPTRYNKRLSYRASQYKGIDVKKLIENDELVTVVKVGDYDCTIAFQGVLDTLVSVLKLQPRPNVTLQAIIRTLNRAIDNTDLLVDCECGDWIYRFAYWATKFGYKYGKPETRPAKITNPDDKKGAMCKHLTAILANKRWLVKIGSIVNDIIKNNADAIRERLGLDEDKFIVNVPGRPSLKTNRNPRMIQKKDNNEPSESEDNRLELDEE